VPVAPRPAERFGQETQANRSDSGKNASM